MDKQWYVVNTYSGHESKVKEKLEMRTESMGMQDYIHRIIIPEEKVVEVKDGVTKEKIKKMFPGYILVEMVMTDEAWYIVRNTPCGDSHQQNARCIGIPFLVFQDKIGAQDRQQQ